MVATKTERRKEQFIRSLAIEINSVLKSKGTAHIKPTPWNLAGVPHLCIAYDHDSPDELQENLTETVSAIWRAAQSGGWLELEWEPLEIEWPKVAVVHLVRGKALLPACSTISTRSLFTKSDEFKVQLHHYTATLINPDVFAESGFAVWENPLVRSLIKLQGNVLAFAVTHFRFYNLAKLILEQKLGQSDTDRILAGFSSEMKTVLRSAQNSYTDVVQILSSSDAPEKSNWLRELELLCRFLLIELDPDTAVAITLDTLTAWMEHFQATNPRFQKLVLDILSFTLKLPSTNPPLTQGS